MFPPPIAPHANRVLRLITTAALLVLLTYTQLLAQSLSSASVRGKVSDETGLALPGVTVTLSSPALQVREVVAVTQGDGNYQFLDVPPGEYQIRFDLPGFQRVVRAGIQLTARFAATINEILKVGGVEESITVSGASPVVDVTNTSSNVSVSGELLNKTVPISRTLQEIMSVAPGMKSTGRPDLGGGTISGGSFKSYGVSGQITNLVEGINTRQDANSPGNAADYASMAEMQINSIGADAETALPGASVNLIIKSGGNDFHGNYEVRAQHSKFQSNNVDDTLRAQGVTIGDALKYNRDLTADLGGRILRDKLWFYGALRDLRNDNSVLGYSRSPGPDGRFQTADDVPGSRETYNNNQTVKVSYQMTRKYRLIGFWTRGWTDWPERGGDRFNPFEATRTFHWDPTEWKGEIQGTPKNNMLFNVVAGNYYYDADYIGQTGFENVPSRFDRETGLFTGSAIAQDRRPRERWQTTGSMTLFPQERLGGGHEFKIGYSFYNEWMGTGQPNHGHGNYQLVYDRSATGLSHQPAEIRTYNYPVNPKNRLNEYGIYGKDTWRVTDRLTLNLGLRWDGFHTFIPPQAKVQGTFGTAGDFPYIDVMSWHKFAPRAGVAFDLTGDSKTVVKATYGWFNHTPGDSFAEDYNQNNITTYTYRWRDLDGNDDYTPGEVNLNVNGPDFLSVTGATNAIQNPDLKDPHTHEISAAFERELVSNFGFRALYVYKRQTDLYQPINVLRPFTSFNIPMNRRDPGADGLLNTADDGGGVTIYDYDAAFRGSQFVGSKRLNRPSGHDDDFQTLEFTANKRMTGRWSLSTSFSTTKNHRWLSGISESPNDDYFPVDNSWEWDYKASGTYRLPRDIVVSPTFNLYNGVPGQRTYVFRAVDPDGGPRLQSLNTVTLRLEPFGATKGPIRSLMNVRVSKAMKFSKQELRLDLDVLNALNANAPWNMVFASGPTFGQYQQILPPRVLRAGVSYSF
jgi:hypothetical protein